MKYSTRMTVFAFATAALLSTSVLAHSWIDCVKYDPFNEQCLGYPRGYPTRKAADINTAYAYLFNDKPTTQAMCNPKQQSTPNYAADFPMATAQPGETIYTSWEQNGHMNNASPTKVYILYYADSTKEFSTVSERTTAPVAGSFNFATTANCYTTQANSVCLGQWVVPKNLAPGKTYHFVWFWYFNQNPAGEWYSTCFDLNIQDKSHVVGTAPMATLLKKGDPPDSYAYGLNAEAKSLIAKVTELSGDDATSSATAAASTKDEPDASSSSAADNAMTDDVESPSFAAMKTIQAVPATEDATPTPTPTPASGKKCRQRPFRRT